LQPIIKIENVQLTDAEIAALFKGRASLSPLSTQTGHFDCARVKQQKVASRRPHRITG
jgi:hypothetical protein